VLAVAISVTSSLLKSEGEEKITRRLTKMVSVVMPPRNAQHQQRGGFAYLSPGMSVTLPLTNSETAETNLMAGSAAKQTLWRNSRRPRRRRAKGGGPAHP